MIAELVPWTDSFHDCCTSPSPQDMSSIGNLHSILKLTLPARTDHIPPVLWALLFTWSVAEPATRAATMSADELDASAASLLGRVCLTSSKKSDQSRGGGWLF